MTSTSHAAVATAIAAATTATDTGTTTSDASHVRLLTVGRAVIRYRTYGSGPGLVLVHGTGSGSATWDALIERFADHHTVVLPDLSGSDPVQDDGGPLTLDDLTGQLAAVIEDVDLGRVDVVGHSLGAVVALALAATRPTLIRRLIPLAGYSDNGEEYFRNTIEQFIALGDRPDAFARYAMLTAFSRRHLNSIGRAAVDELAGSFALTPNRMRQFELIRRADIRDLLPRISLPTLVIGCAGDNLVPVENTRGIHAAIPGSAYAELDCGHVARVERPDELTALIRDFLDRTAAA